MIFVSQTGLGCKKNEMFQSNILNQSLIEFAFKLELVKKMSLVGVLFESNQSFQFEVFLFEAKRNVIVGNCVEMGNIFVIVKSRIGILVLEIKMHFWTF